jgi:5-methylcytosine-specific restriction enzyme subunit McrC
LRNRSTRPIPIENVYHLFCYAWNYFPSAPSTQVGDAEGPGVPTLLAKVLIAAVNDARRRGFPSGYVTEEVETPRIRGRILVNRSIVLGSLFRAAAVCQIDTFCQDTPLNRIVKDTLRRLVRMPILEPTVVADARTALKCFDQVQDSKVTRDLLYRIQIQPGNRIHFVLLSICRLLFEVMTPKEGEGHHRFSDVLDDEVSMARVFQQFVRTFYELELRGAFRVGSERLSWKAAAVDEEDLRLLPSMITDVTLSSPTRSIIVECKYYRRTLQQQFLSSTLHSSHVYQLFAYLRNVDPRDERFPREGILLYPCTGGELNLRFSLHGHPIRVRTLDLCQKWSAIKNDLLELVQ